MEKCTSILFYFISVFFKDTHVLSFLFSFVIHAQYFIHSGTKKFHFQKRFVQVHMLLMSRVFFFPIL